ncbi:MAG: hypothetical protein ACLUVG_16395 [Phocaeicola vulgatus]
MNYETRTGKMPGLHALNYRGTATITGGTEVLKYNFSANYQNEMVFC